MSHPHESLVSGEARRAWLVEPAWPGRPGVGPG